MELPFFGIGLKIDLSSPVATTEFSKFSGILLIIELLVNMKQLIDVEYPLTHTHTHTHSRKKYLLNKV